MQALWLGRTGWELAHRRKARRWSRVSECRSLAGAGFAGVAVVVCWASGASSADMATRAAAMASLNDWLVVNFVLARRALREVRVDALGGSGDPVGDNSLVVARSWALVRSAR